MATQKTTESTESAVKREMVATPEQVAARLALTRAKKLVIQKEQNELLEVYHSRARLSPEEQARARGIELERHHKKTHNRDARAEALGLQGKFAQAARVAESTELKTVMRERRSAAKRGNCKCPAFYTAEDGTILPNQYVEMYNYSEVHNAVVPFVRCRTCPPKKSLSVQTMPDHLAEQQKQRRASENGAEVPAKQFFRQIAVKK